jgi:protein involved in polysaccharide export with SLBB domain
MNSYLTSVRSFIATLGVGLALGILTGCATTGTGRMGDPVGKASGDNPVTSGSDILRTGDTVIINFSGVSDPPQRVDDRISQDGKITLPFILEPVQAAGKTRLQLQRDIKALYVPKYFQQLTVTVNADTRYFFVYGEVRKPGPYPYVAQITVTKAIASAGGFTDFAKRKKIQLKRGNSKPITVNSDKAQESPEFDLPVYPDDTIFVPRRYW